MIICFVIAVGFLIVILLIWLFYGNGVDKIKHPEEWLDKGKCGERALFLTLTKKYKVPENQIFRNVYIPTSNGTTEIDLLIVSKKGLLVFECKNYGGTIYGDGRQPKWIQYIGGQKNFFLSPVVQNRGHVKHLRERYKNMPDLPITPFVVMTMGAKWKLRNISDEDNVMLGKRLSDVYEMLPDAKVMEHYLPILLKDLKALERPSEEVRMAHIQQIKK